MDQEMMRSALEQAYLAFESNEVPVGAVIEYKGQIIGKGHNKCISLNDPTAHAEVIALRDAGKNINNYRLDDANLYVTLEPCMMCASAIVHARLNKVYFGTPDLKTGAITSKSNFFGYEYLNHSVKFQGGILKNESSGILKKFFKSKRN